MPPPTDVDSLIVTPDIVNKLVYDHLAASGEEYSEIASSFFRLASLDSPGAKSLDRTKLLPLAQLVQDFVVLKEQAERTQAVRSAHMGAKRAFSVRLGEALASLYEDTDGALGVSSDQSGLRCAVCAKLPSGRRANNMSPTTPSTSAMPPPTLPSSPPPSTASPATLPGSASSSSAAAPTTATAVPPPKNKRKRSLVPKQRAPGSATAGPPRPPPPVMDTTPLSPVRHSVAPTDLLSSPSEDGQLDDSMELDSAAALDQGLQAMLSDSKSIYDIGHALASSINAHGPSLTDESLDQFMHNIIFQSPQRGGRSTVDRSSSSSSESSNRRSLFGDDFGLT